ncbi:MAG: hypothetical protein Q4B28_03915 [bacterium]|nr:hypothetical protein [bacterium]
MKTLLCLFIIGLSLFVGQYSFASDCSILTNTSMQNYANSYFPLLYQKDPLLQKKVVPEALIQRALLNLQAHCCSSGLGDTPSCEQDTALRNGRSNYPQSPFLFDHLIDVLMRRRNYDTSYPNFPFDPQAKERKQKIEKLILDAEGQLPTTFLADYDTYRSVQPEYLLASPSEQEGFQLLTTPGEIEKLNTFPQRNLRTKFLNTCQIAIYLRMKLIPGNPDQPLLTLLQPKCEALISKLLKEENQFLHNTIIYKSNKLITNTLKNYGEIYFGNRINSLQLKIDQLMGQLQSVAKQVTKLIPQCS